MTHVSRDINLCKTPRHDQYGAVRPGTERVGMVYEVEIRMSVKVGEVFDEEAARRLFEESVLSIKKIEKIGLTELEEPFEKINRLISGSIHAREAAG